MEEYIANAQRHFNEPVIRDAKDGKKWVSGQIQWFVEQVRDPKKQMKALLTIRTQKGKSISSDGIKRAYLIKHVPGQEHQPWETSIVMSSVARDKLPTNIRQRGFERLCKISSTLRNKEVGDFANDSIVSLQLCSIEYLSLSEPLTYSVGRYEIEEPPLVQSWREVLALQVRH